MNNLKRIITSALFILPFFFFSLSDLQTQSFENTYAIFDNGLSYATYAQQTANNQYLLTGIAIDWDNPDTTIFVMKVNESGEEIWSKTIPLVGGLSQRPSLIEDSQENVYVAGTKKYLPNHERVTIIAKYDENGVELWQEEFEGNSWNDNTFQIALANNGDILVVINTDQQIQVRRIDSEGNLVWSTLYEVQWSISFFDVAISSTLDGNFVLASHWAGSLQKGILMIKIDGLGNTIWSETYDILEIAENLHIVETTDGELLIGGYNKPGSSGLGPGFVIKTDSNGQELWQALVGSDQANMRSLGLDTEGRSLLVGNDNSEPIIHVISANGDYLGAQTLDNLTANLHFIINTSDNGYAVAGSAEVAGIPQAYLYKEIGGINIEETNILEGQIFTDLNENCIYDGEIGVQNWYVQATKGNQNWYTITDTNGTYELFLPSGDYEISVELPSAIYEVCEEDYPISFLESNEIQILNLPILNLIGCPYLEVHIANLWDLRICEETTYEVSYCNYGNITAEDAYIEITLDQYQTLINSSIPITDQVNNTFTFELGNIEIGNCDEFNFEIALECDSSIVGYTHCVEAHIFPDTICIDTAEWSGASLQVSGECQDGNINFKAKNIGSATTTPILDFVVIEDQVIYLQGGVNDLLPDTEEVLASIPANGKTYRIQVEQENGHPGISMPTTFIEGCIENNNQLVSTGFVNLFPPDDANHFIDINCVESNYPFDPNDKLAIPYGYGDEHFINANQQIEYTIRFQNTGTAPAFNVVIRDTLPETLNPVTLRSGASSHPYNFTMEGTGIAIFTFENINLPDSTTNFDASQGFVKFDIHQQRDLPIGSMIENNAAIFFDLASPVITDKWFHTIGEDFIMVNTINPEFKNLSIKAFPNPFFIATTIVLEGLEIQGAELQLFNAAGQLVRNEKFQNNKLEINREMLSTGIYFFAVHAQGKFVGNGKIVIH